MRRHLVLATYFFLLMGHPALAATPAKPPPAPPSAPAVTLTKEQVSVVEWFVHTYGGEHCTLQDDNTFLYCQAAVQGKLLLMDLDRQLAAKPAASAK